MITLDEYLASKGPEFRKEVDKQYSEMAMEYSLSRLREELQMSQKELANNLNIFARLRKRRGCGVVHAHFLKEILKADFKLKVCLETIS